MPFASSPSMFRKYFLIVGRTMQIVEGNSQILGTGQTNIPYYCCVGVSGVYQNLKYTNHKLHKQICVFVIFMLLKHKYTFLCVICPLSAVRRYVQSKSPTAVQLQVNYHCHSNLPMTINNLQLIVQ